MAAETKRMINTPKTAGHQRLSRRSRMFLSSSSSAAGMMAFFQRTPRTDGLFAFHPCAFSASEVTATTQLALYRVPAVTDRPQDEKRKSCSSIGNVRPAPKPRRRITRFLIDSAHFTVCNALHQTTTWRNDGRMRVVATAWNFDSQTAYTS